MRSGRVVFAGYKKNCGGLPGLGAARAGAVLGVLPPEVRIRFRRPVGHGAEDPSRSRRIERLCQGPAPPCRGLARSPVGERLASHPAVGTSSTPASTCRGATGSIAGARRTSPAAGARRATTTLAGVPAERIGESLAFINWTVLTALGAGVFAAVVAGRFRTDATRGYLAFTAFSAAAFAGLAALADTGLPVRVSRPGDPAGPGVGWAPPDRARRPARVRRCVRRGGRWGGVGRGRSPRAASPPRRWRSSPGALSWGGGGLGSLLLLVELLVLVRGARWRVGRDDPRPLVPRDAEACRRRRSSASRAGSAWRSRSSSALFVVWLAVGAGPGGEPAFAALVGPWALFVWLRLLVGPRVPADRELGGGPDGALALDGVRDGAPVHQRRNHRRRHDPRRRAVLRRGAAGLTVAPRANDRGEGAWHEPTRAGPRCGRSRLDRGDRPADSIPSCSRWRPPPRARADPDPEPRQRPDAGASSRSNRGRVVEVGTAIGYSTLWMALALPADGTIVTIDPDRSSAPSGRAPSGARPDCRTSRIAVVNAPALEAFAGATPELAGPFDMVFIDALKDEYLAYLSARRGPALRRARSSSPTTCCGAGARPGRARPGLATAPRLCASSAPGSRPTRRSRRRSCRSATACSWRRCGRSGWLDARPGPAVRDAA